MSYQGIRATIIKTGQLVDVRKDRNIMRWVNCNNKAETFKPEELKFES